MQYREALSSFYALPTAPQCNYTNSVDETRSNRDTTWRTFLDRVLHEWSFVVGLQAAVATTLGILIPAAYQNQDVTTLTFGLTALMASAASTVVSAIYVVWLKNMQSRDGLMRYWHNVLSDSRVMCEISIVVAVPRIWTGWTIILLGITVLSYVWASPEPTQNLSASNTSSATMTLPLISRIYLTAAFSFLISHPSLNLVRMWSLTRSPRNTLPYHISEVFCFPQIRIEQDATEEDLAIMYGLASAQLVGSINGEPEIGGVPLNSSYHCGARGAQDEVEGSGNAVGLTTNRGDTALMRRVGMTQKRKPEARKICPHHPEIDCSQWRDVNCHDMVHISPMEYASNFLCLVGLPWFRPSYEYLHVAKRECKQEIQIFYRHVCGDTGAKISFISVTFGISEQVLWSRGSRLSADGKVLYPGPELISRILHKMVYCDKLSWKHCTQCAILREALLRSKSQSFLPSPHPTLATRRTTK